MQRGEIMNIEDMKIESLLLAKAFCEYAEVVGDTQVQSVLVQFAYEEKLHADYLKNLLTNKC